MKSIQKICNTYGITQQQLSEYLSVSAALLNMAARGTRELPDKALQKLARFYPAKTSITGTVLKKKQTVLQQQGAATAKAVQAQITDCTLAVTKARRQLSKLEEKYAQAENALQLSAHLRQITSTRKAESLWADVLEADALKQLSQCGQQQQVLLQLKIKSLDYQLQLLKSWESKR